MKRNLPCEIHVDDAVYTANTTDITERRLLVQSDAKLAPGTNLHVRIPAVAEIAEFWVKARVAQGGTQGPRELALRIVEAPPVYQVLTMPGFEIETQEAGRAKAATSEGDVGSGSRRAVLLDVGNLGPIIEILDELEVDYACVNAEQALRAAWPAPQQLFVCSARLALSPSFPMPPLFESVQLVGIAVAETTSQTLARNVQRLGFRYLVSLPAHPDALRLLVRESLFRKSDKRSAPRHAVGTEISWRAGLRRRSATLIEVSESGGRLHTAAPVDEGSTLCFTIPAEAGRGHSVKLRGRVVRSERRRGIGFAEPHAIALCWENLGSRTVAHLAQLLTARAVGPAPFRDPGAAPSATPETLATASRESRSESPPTSLQDRRQNARAVLHGEVVSLNDDNSVERVLVCRDLSSTGMRVDPHPSLAEGTRLRVALLEPSDPAPLVLDAEVVRDAADAGLGLHFLEVPADTSARLRALVDRLPAVQTLQPRAERVVLGRIVEPED